MRYLLGGENPLNSNTFSFEKCMRQALAAAQVYEGATAPNPPVGAVILDAHGVVLAVGAHSRAGSPHAEIEALNRCREAGTLECAHTVVVTLEPCNHTGRTPPCTEALITAGIKRVVFGLRDANPGVRGGGIEKLRAAAIECHGPVLEQECRDLLRAFLKWSTTGLPWVTVKTAWNASGSMIPSPGQKTFTSEASLKLAHELRKKADAVLTGSGTVLADQPEFTVRKIPDHPGKKRWLVVLDRRKRVSEEWIQKAQSRGFRVRTDLPLEEALGFLGSQGCLEVLVEAGPALSTAILATELWDEHIKIHVKPGQEDEAVLLRRQK